MDLGNINKKDIEDIEIDTFLCIQSMPCGHSCRIKINGEWKSFYYVVATDIYDICKQLNKKMDNHFDYLFDEKLMKRFGNEPLTRF